MSEHTASTSASKPLHVQVAEALGWTASYSKHRYWIVHHGYGDPWGAPDASCQVGFDTRPPEFSSATGKRVPDPQWWDHDGGCSHVPLFDTDWSTTGPLIERLQITLCSPYADGRAHDYDEATQGAPPWEAAVPDIQRADHTWERGLYVSGATPLVAVCNLILLLKQHGKLPALEDLTR